MAPLFHAHPFALADRDGTIASSLAPESVADQVSASSIALYGATSGHMVTVPCLTLSSARRRLKLPRIDVLKLDREGAEFSVPEQAATNGWLEGVTQLFVEFHHLLPGLIPTHTRNAISLLTGMGFAISWIGRTNHEYLFARMR